MGYRPKKLLLITLLAAALVRTATGAEEAEESGSELPSGATVRIRVLMELDGERVNFVPTEVLREGQDWWLGTLKCRRVVEHHAPGGSAAAEGGERVTAADRT